MNYYEELAVAQDASLEEIHQAYRILARLLHPDNQSDSRLKPAAERQMIRLNEILATLSDADKRRQYDESICRMAAVREPAPPPPPPQSRIRPLYRHWPWGLACCILLGGGFWYLRVNESGEPAAFRPVAPAPPSSAQPVQSARAEDTRATSKNRLLRKKRLLSELPVIEEFEPGESSAPAQPASQLPEASEPPAAVQGEARETAPPVQPKPVPPEAPATLSLAGHWFYAPQSADPPTPGMYPPEFIELFLSEDQGALSGTYWARYRIPDKAVSPEVKFRVSGASAEGNTATLGWVSDDGAQGQLQMVLHDSNSMEVRWWTSAFGRRTALTSGTARLVRERVH